MISHIKGRIRTRRASSLILEVSEHLTYEIFVPKTVMQAMEKQGNSDERIELVTYYYLQTDPSRSIPTMIGFINEVEKEFFEKFITVSGVGPKAACKALILPFSEIADAIDKGDTSLLKTLPGIGEQRAREIVAKLQGRVGKFGLIQDKHPSGKGAIREDAKAEALSVLLQLQYKKKEAEDMLRKALERSPNIKTSEELLNEVYKTRQNEQRKHSQKNSN